MTNGAPRRSVGSITSRRTAAGYAPRVAARNFEICIDANDPAVLRPFWRTALGYIDQQTAEGAVDLVDPAGVLPTVWFQKVPEVKRSKNRVHLDIRVRAQEREPPVEALVTLRSPPIRGSPRWRTRRATSYASPPNEQRPGAWMVTPAVPYQGSLVRRSVGR
jgi:hypothetical protein